MGQDQSTPRYNEHIPPQQLKKTHHRIFSHAEPSNFSSFKPQPDIPKKSTSFLDNLPPKDVRPSRDDFSISYNEFEAGNSSTTMKSKISSTFKSYLGSQEKRKSEDFDTAQIEENTENQQKRSNVSENIAPVDAAFASQDLIPRHGRAYSALPKSFVLSCSETSSNPSRNGLRIDHNAIGPHIAAHEEHKLVEKDLEDDGDIVMRTDTYGRDPEPLDKAYKEIMDSPLCQLETLGDEEAKIGNRGISRGTSPRPKRYEPVQQSPELLYRPNQINKGLDEYMKQPANYYQTTGRPIYIASLEDHQLHDNLTETNLLSSASIHNLSILHQEHQSLSPEKIDKSYRALDRKDGAYDGVEFSFKPESLAKDNHPHAKELKNLVKVQGLPSDHLKDQKAQINRNNTKKDKESNNSDLDPLSPEFFLNPSYTNHSATRSTHSRSKSNNTTLDIKNTSKSNRYLQDHHKSDLDKIPELQLNSPKYKNHIPVLKYLETSATVKPNTTQNTPQNAVIGPIRQREPYLQRVTPPAYLNYGSITDQLDSPDLFDNIHQVPLTSHYPTSSQSTRNNPTSKMHRFEEKNLATKFLYDEIANKENQFHPNVPRTLPSTTRNQTLKNKPLQILTNPSTTRNSGRSSKAGQTFKPSPSPTFPVQKRPSGKGHVKANSFSKEVGQGSTASSVKASRDIETLKKRTYQVMDKVRALREEPKPNILKGHRRHVSGIDERSFAMNNIKLIEEHFGGSFQIDDSSLAKRNKSGRTERKDELNKQKKNSTSREKSPNSGFSYRPSIITNNKFERTVLNYTKAIPTAGDNTRNVKSSRTSVERKNSIFSHTPKIATPFNYHNNNKDHSHYTNSRDESIYVVSLGTGTPKEIVKHSNLSRVNSKNNLHDHHHLIQPSSSKYIAESQSELSPEKNYRIEKTFTHKNVELDGSLDPSYMMDPPDRPFSRLNSVYLEQMPEEMPEELLSERSSYHNNPLDDRDSEGCVEMGDY